MSAKKKTKDESQDCEHCGRCRHCGRREAGPVYVPVYPYSTTPSYPIYLTWPYVWSTTARPTITGNAATTSTTYASGNVTLT